MNRLPLELQRLYAAQAAGSPDADAPALVDAAGRVRAMVLQIARPADWQALSRVWTGVQADLELPAPAIAVSGEHGYQLWFSLAQPVPAPQAAAFLEGLRERYLNDVKPSRVALLPTVDAASPQQVVHAAPVPALQGESGRWSAFVAPDLAPVFADEPWLDLPPNPDGQANLLSRLQSMPEADFAAALARLTPAAASVPSPPAPEPAVAAATPAPAGGWQDPRHFLLDVMNDASVALGLRIEAAKALLSCPGEVRRP